MQENGANYEEGHVSGSSRSQRSHRHGHNERRSICKEYLVELEIEPKMIEETLKDNVWIMVMEKELPQSTKNDI
ncbi:hypothetical protein CR513_39517, partial [Mucuna pruriens]